MFSLLLTVADRFRVVILLFSFILLLISEREEEDLEGATAFKDLVSLETTASADKGVVGSKLSCSLS
jgi:hypothetical protein